MSRISVDYIRSSYSIIDLITDSGGLIVILYFAGRILSSGIESIFFRAALIG